MGFVEHGSVLFINVLSKRSLAHLPNPSYFFIGYHSLALKSPVFSMAAPFTQFSTSCLALIKEEKGRVANFVFRDK